jgi:hypothetical protein
MCDGPLDEDPCGNHQCIRIGEISCSSHQCIRSQTSEFHSKAEAQPDGQHSDEEPGGEDPVTRESSRSAGGCDRNRRWRRHSSHSIELGHGQVAQSHTLSLSPCLELGCHASGSPRIGHGVRAHSCGGRGACREDASQFCSGDCADDFLGRRPFTIFHEQVLPSSSPSLGHPIVMPLREAAKNVRLREACLRTSELDGEINTLGSQVTSDGSNDQF